jgi:hypothetical protein
MVDTDYDDVLENDIGLDPEDRAKVKTNRLDWYKAEKDRCDRLALVYFHNIDVGAVRLALKKNPAMTSEEKVAVGRAALEARAAELKKAVDALTPVDKLNLSDVRFKRFTAHFDSRVGFVISRLGKDGQEADEAWRMLEEPKDYFTTLVLLYPTDREGEVNKDALKAGMWKLMPWRFSADRYLQILKRNKGLVANGVSIATQDLEITCKDTQYQNISIDVGGPAIYRMSPKFQEVVLTKAIDMYEKLNPFREMSTSDLRIKLGLGGGGGTNIGPDDFGDVLDNV